MHLHKSGGTFINDMIMQCVPYARQIGYHLPYSELPRNFRHYDVMGTVRNPWSYYVSWYHFQEQSKSPNMLFLQMSDSRKLYFVETITNLLNLSSNEAAISRFEDVLPTTFSSSGQNLTRQCIQALRFKSQGFYSFLYERHYLGCKSPIILDTNSLRQGLLTYIDEKEISPRDKLVNYINCAPKQNTSQHKDYQHYYTDELAALVANKDELIIKRYGYKFNSQ